MTRRLIIGIVLLAALFVDGCGRSGRPKAEAGSTAPDTLVDAAGRSVSIPPVVSRVVSPFTMYTRLIVAMGGCEKLAGISHSCVLPEEERGCGGRLLTLPDIGEFGMNIELIASLKPDLIFASQADVASFSSKTDAAVVAVSFPSDIPMLEMFDRQIDLIGKAMRLQAGADSLKRFIAKTVRPVVSITSSLPDSVKPKVYFAWTSWTGDILNTLYKFDPIELAGGINVAGEANNFARNIVRHPKSNAKREHGIIVSREHIMKWNPDFIFISRFQVQSWQKGGPAHKLPMTINDVLADPLMQSVNAVKNRRIYYTTASCNWWPQQRALLQVLYMAKLFHPDLFRDLDVEREGNRIFKRFYGADDLYTAMARDLELYSWK
ncbi:MAG: ABC transporter substrate-binding protein [Chitinispirillaceae bacterium]|nr:ABC transporter substrate-binding protein [Chitinispirillaceae bacterium]